MSHRSALLLSTVSVIFSKLIIFGNSSMNRNKHYVPRLPKVVVKTMSNGHINRPNLLKRRQSLYDDNLAAGVNVEKASELYKVQVNAVWREEEQLLANAFHKCAMERQLTGSTIPIRILDVGCGTGEMITRLVGRNGLFQQVSNYTNQPFEIDAVELDHSFYEFCKHRFDHLKNTTQILITCHQVCATKLPFEANTFDLVMNRHMLHCVPVDRIPNVLSETYRVLKPGGIVHFVAEDMGMIFSSTDDSNKMTQHEQLWSNGICDTGRKLGVDLRIGRKLPAMLPAHGLLIQSIKHALIDTHNIDRQLLVDIFEFWREIYVDVWKRNNIDYTYDKYFQNFIEVVKDRRQYICWSLPIIQAVKRHKRA